MKLVEQKLTALTFSSRVTLGTVVLSPSGSSVVLHGKSMLWPFYLLHYTGYKFEFQILFFLTVLYRVRLFLFFFFLSFSYTVYGNKLYHLTVFEMNVLTQENGIGFILCLL